MRVDPDRLAMTAAALERRAPKLVLLYGLAGCAVGALLSVAPAALPLVCVALGLALGVQQAMWLRAHARALQASVELLRQARTPTVEPAAELVRLSPLGRSLGAAAEYEATRSATARSGVHAIEAGDVAGEVAAKVAAKAR